MNQLKRLSIMSIFLFFFSLLSVSCFRGSNGTNAITSLHNENQIYDHSNNKISSFILQSQSLEMVSDELADSIANEIVNALQKDSSSFLQEGIGFDIKGQIKKHAKEVLKEVAKAGIQPIEEVVAASVKPPTISPHAYKLLKPVLKTLFNKVEQTIKKDVPDSIWDYEGDDSEEMDEQEEESFDELADSMINED
ncbi:cell traversal protein for ookinetes and sporozoites, putative [Plasmodium relictum]|uniref:Cell traversal protein for ookinetes and sporozoites, putative n=1 Tax=Plasmodium relictum TaxID=85471 RepID=A0A1J1HB15_PLARL|nr:cell traversal protein for ookinetes and sporozoites, putative [Plasmodium relictum]CRH02595.1 cell traversal protein for ookinetes and sporozoites, putative [Plasmodium relictum]